MTRSRFVTALVYLFLIYVPLQPSVASPDIKIEQLQQSNGKLNILPFIDILVDESNKLTIDDVTEQAASDLFIPGTVIGNSFGFSKASYWVRFTINNSLDANTPLLLELDHPSIDHVSLFYPQKDGHFRQTVTGESVFFDSREVHYRSFLFSIPVKDQQTSTYYLLLRTQGSMHIPLKLWTFKTFIDEKELENLFLGSYFGVMHILMLSMLISFFMSRDKLFLYYALYLLSASVFQASLNGFSFQYMWPNLPEWSSRFTALSLGFTVICSLIFSAAFLQLWTTKYRYLKALYLFIIALTSIGMLMVLFGGYSKGVILLSLVGGLIPPIILIVAIISMQSGYPPARYFLVAWALFLIGVFIQALLYFGLIPPSMFSVYSMQVGSIFEVTLLGFALMKRIELLRLDKERAQLNAQQSLFKLNHKLESLVAERTAGLQDANQALKELVSHDGLTGLLNHNASIDYLKRMQTLTIRHLKPLAVIMLDIDFFKIINDNFGHPVGDKVIVAIASILKNNLRDSDGAGRYGGEEFVLILPETDLDSAKELADRIRENIMKVKIADLGEKEVTASFGISVFDPHLPNSDLINQADIALYKAKASGRNKVMVFDPIS